MWHGGIHITEGCAGQALDLDAGLRCIADGVLIAYRANKDYPVSEVAPSGSSAPFQAPYSTGFALVRHEMEFPRGAKLTFYSLYMHLMSNADYDNYPKRQKPSYWSRQWQITQYAQDKPQPRRGGQPADPAQVGLHVRKTPGGSIVGILPQGAGVTIGKAETVHGATWGQLTDLGGATLYAPEAGGYVEPTAGLTGWIFLGAQNGGPVAKESIPDSMFERVIVTTNQSGTANDPQGAGGGIPVKAGDLMGHLGRYDSLNESSSGTRMAHIEVFCDEGIKPFINAGRAWVDTHVEETAAATNQWSDLGVSQDPVILRVDLGTKLYQTHANGQPGNDPKQTDVIQVYQFAALPQDDTHMFMETDIDKDHGNDGHKRRWWKVDGADALRNPISGWVREQSFEGGRVTRESAQSWIDFECHDEDHDPTHTIFATTADYVDYALGGDTPGAGSLAQLSPLMAALYRVLYPSGDGQRAADDLCSMGQSAQDGFPWAAFRASRLIPKHESEWANPAKWQALVSAIEERTGPKPEHEEEKKRIAKLVWWDEVAAGARGFPGPDVYHINPIGLVGNFYIETDYYEFQTSEGIFKVSKRAFQLILSSEGYGPKPYVPGGDQSSGVTVGYGYDLGQQETATIETDLNGIFTADQIERLVQASSKHGDTARKLIPSLSDISVSPDMAMRLAVVMKRRFAQQTVDAFPGVTSLHPHCQGALLSLVINRGPGMKDKPGQKTRENMRAIRDDIETRSYADIPAQLRDMKKLWDPSAQRGLLIRREQEAVLFSDGLDNSTTR